MLESEIEKCHKDSKILVLYGIHGTFNGLLDVSDEKLKKGFKRAINNFIEDQEDTIKRKNIAIKGLEIMTTKRKAITTT